MKGYKGLALKIVLMALLCIRFFCLEAYGDEVIPATEFEDENFYRFVLENFDADGDGVLMQSEVEAAYRIELNKNNITNIVSIKGIEYLKNLHEVDIYNNKGITDGSPIGMLNNVEMLYMGETGISDISFLANMENLYHLQINNSSQSECLIKDFGSISGLTNLRYLDLYYQSNVKDISFLSELRQLVSLELSHTGIKDISPLMASKDSLTQVLLNENEILDFSYLEQMNNLEDIQIGYNTPRIKELPDLTGLPGLRMLGVSGNELTEEEIARKTPSYDFILVAEDQYSGENDTKETSAENNNPGNTEGNTTPGNNTADGRKSFVSVLDGAITAIGIFEEGVWLEGKKIDDISEYGSMLDKIHEQINDIIKTDIYDIAFYREINENGKTKKEKVQPKGRAEIIIKLDELIEGKYHVVRQEENGSLTELECFVREGKLHFYSDHFSIFTIIISKLFGDEETSTIAAAANNIPEESSQENSQGDNNEEENKEKENGESTDEEKKDDDTEEKTTEDMEGNINTKEKNSAGIGKETVMGIAVVAGVLGIIMIYEAVRRKKVMELGNLERRGKEQ